MRPMSSTSHRPWRPNGESAEQRSINLSIDAELLSTAKALDIDLALSLEETLRATIEARSGQPVNEGQQSAANCNAAERLPSW